MDTTLANLLLHATTQIRILKEVLINLEKADGANVQEELKKCVQQYVAIAK